MKPVLLAFAAAAMLSCVSGSSGSEASSPGPLKYFTREEIARAKTYEHTGNTLRFVRIGVTAALFLLLIYTGTARRFAEFAASRISSFPLRVLACFILVFAIHTAVLFPIRFYRSYVVEHQYGFSNYSLGRWLGDFFKGSAISLVLGAILAVGLYWLLKTSPRWWWLLGTGAFALYVAVLILLTPVLIDPIFSKFTPMQDRRMRADIVALAKKAGIEVGEVLVMDASRRTSHTNAYFTGFGHTKRIVVYDTLVKEHTSREVLSVIAHEIGHWKYAHIYKGYVLGIIGTLLVFLIIKFAGARLLTHMPLGTDTLASPATIPLLFLIIFACNLVSLPAQNALSRRFERQADQTALELTGDGETFIQMQVKLARVNASDPDPPALVYYWFHTHPSTLERIAAGERYGN